jgi:hypothetical protein
VEEKPLVVACIEGLSHSLGQSQHLVSAGIIYLSTPFTTSKPVICAAG